MTTLMRPAAMMVAEARLRVKSLTPEQLAAEVQGGQAVLVDLREPTECAQTGLIPGAIQAPRGMLEFYADPTCPYHRPELDPSLPVILYCASGGRSALAADLLMRMGYADVAHLDSGIKGWQAAGYETVGVA
jgi:rhodanese-related sulfurtransferase